MQKRTVICLVQWSKKNPNLLGSDFSNLAMGYKKDIFAVFAYEFELSHNR